MLGGHHGPKKNRDVTASSVIIRFFCKLVEHRRKILHLYASHTRHHPNASHRHSHIHAHKKKRIPLPPLVPNALRLSSLPVGRHAGSPAASRDLYKIQANIPSSNEITPILEKNRARVFIFQDLLKVLFFTYFQYVS